MADQLQIRRGTTAQNNAFTGAQGELTMDTDLKGLRVHDNLTPGGFALATQTQVFNGTFYFNDDTSGGSVANAYILAPKANTNAPTQYLDGQQFGFTTGNANTGSSTATFSGLGVKSLKYRGGVDPAAGDIFGRVYLIYDATNDWFEIQRKAVAAPPQIRNLTGSVAANALTALMPAQTVDFRGAPITNGTTTSITFTSDISITAPSGATLGTASGALSRIVILALNNAGTVVLGLTNSTNNTISFDETELVATTAISAAATSANVVYSAVGLSNVPYRVVGYIESTQTTAGVWASSPSKVQGQGGQAIIGLQFSRQFQSAEQTITSGGALTIAHGLGATPDFWTILLICKTAEIGYSVGDVTEVSGTQDSSVSYGLAVVPDAVNLVCRYGANANAFFLLNKTTGVAEAVTNANWRVILRARA